VELARPSLKVIQTIHAGLGNQLFQYSFIHYVCQHLNINQFSILKSLFGFTKSRPFVLKDVLSKDYKFNTFNRIIWEKYFSLIPYTLNRMDNNYSFQVFKEVDPFKLIDLKNIRGSKVVFYGYFQNHVYVDSVWDQIGPTIFDVTNLKRTLKSRFQEKKYNVIHVRAGDITKSSIQNMGTLSPSYYRSVKDQLNNGLENIIVTDDLNWAKKLKVVAHLPIDTQIIDNNLMNAWETLALMIDAELVISANSTLSWWGSYMCVKKGGKAILPRPWFRNWVGSTEALIWGNCSTQDSIFIDNLNETV
jgi:hypothetical protein